MRYVLTCEDKSTGAVADTYKTFVGVKAANTTGYRLRLRSLFVDEGFGTLDAEGRQRLVEAVKAVQDDFDLVLIITHIDELREAFPTQIQVTKSDSGSLVEVL